MTQMVNGEGPAATRPRPIEWAWMTALAGSIVYIILFTADAYVASIPLKLFLVGLTLVLWLASRPPLGDAGRYPLRWPLLILAVGVPVVWTIVAFVQGHLLGGEAPELRYVAQQASRFGYLLLFFPFCDLLRRDPKRAIWLVVAPVMVLCLFTYSIWVYHLVSGDELNTSSVLIFKGVIGDGLEGFRVFIANQIMFIMVLALLLAWASVRPPRWYEIVAFLLLVSSAWLSHTRGIWLGLCSVCAATLFLCLFVRSGDRWRRILTWVVGAAAVALVAIGILVVSGNDLGGLLGDESTSTRVRQAPELLDSFKESPVFGQGMGATIEGFQRSAENPWSFELTYLQILFQFGLVGFAVFIGSLIYSMLRGFRVYVAESGRAWMPLAGIATLVGMLVASATNPYLSSSFGMLMTAIAMALLVPPRSEGER